MVVYTRVVAVRLKRKDWKDFYEVYGQNVMGYYGSLKMAKAALTLFRLIGGICSSSLVNWVCSVTALTNRIWQKGHCQFLGPKRPAVSISCFLELVLLEHKYHTLRSTSQMEKSHIHSCFG